MGGETVEAIRIFCHGSHPGGDRSDAFYLGFWVTGVADTDLKYAPWCCPESLREQIVAVFCVIAMAAPLRSFTTHPWKKVLRG